MAGMSRGQEHGAAGMLPWQSEKREGGMSSSACLPYIVFCPGPQPMSSECHPHPQGVTFPWLNTHDSHMPTRFVSQAVPHLAKLTVRMSLHCYILLSSNVRVSFVYCLHGGIDAPLCFSSLHLILMFALWPQGHLSLMFEVQLLSGLRS